MVLLVKQALIHVSSVLRTIGFTAGQSRLFYLTKKVLYNYIIIIDEIIFEWDSVNADTIEAAQYGVR